MPEILNKDIWTTVSFSAIAIKPHLYGYIPLGVLDNARILC